MKHRDAGRAPRCLLIRGVGHAKAIFIGEAKGHSLLRRAFHPVHLGAPALASGCSDADVATARAKAKPDPIGPLATPIHVTAERYGRLPRAYIKTLADKAVSTELQTKLLGATKTTTFELSSGHSPFLSHAPELTDVILRAARAVG